jgi:hypothetical protein
VSVGYTFPLRDDRTGRQFIGWHESTLDGAISDALRQMNEWRAAEFRIVAQIREYVGGVK